MSSYGDFCKEQRKARQRVRMFWHECPTCAVKFGTGTSVAPGANCRNCGWLAPGQRGDDMRAADARDKQLEARRKPRRRGPWEYPYCDWSFADKQSRGKHVSTKHTRQHEAERRPLLAPAHEEAARRIAATPNTADQTVAEILAVDDDDSEAIEAGSPLRTTRQPDTDQ